jgi:hypothetical protein
MQSLVLVLVMHVGNVGVLVLKALVPMRMRMRFARRSVRRVLMLVMLVMDVGMLVLRRHVYVLMLVVLGQVQPHPDCHQQTCGNQLQG